MGILTLSATNIPTPEWAWPWWGVMVAINIINVLVFGFLFYKSVKTDKLEPENKKYKSIMRILGAIYVAVAMYRSCCVSSYPDRLVWFDSMANSPLVIRIFATFAECSFAALILLALLHVNKEVPLTSKFAQTEFGKVLFTKIPYGIVICLWSAQFFAYSGLFTQHLTLFAVEETLWMLGFLSIAPLAVAQCVNVFSKYKNDKSANFIKVFLIVLSVFTIGYLCYQIFYSLPFSYWTQVGEDIANGHHLQGMEALNNALYQFNPTRDFDTWGGIGFFIWHSGYFSLCVWMTIIFSMAPRLKK